MKSAAFDYIAPKNVAEAASALARDDISAIAIAGGQSLVPMLNLRIAQPDLLVDLSRLPELKENGETAEGIRIGALTTHSAIEDGTLSDPFDGLLQKVASGISYRAIRNYGTIGGSVALADPAADWPVTLLALGAKVRIAGRDGERSLPVGEVVTGQYTTSLERTDIILGFDIPRPAAPLRWGFFKVVRKSGAFASSIAIIVERRSGPVSVALGAAAPRPLLLPAIAKALSAHESAEETLRTAIAEDLSAHLPEGDGYLLRLHISTVLHAIREMRRR